MKKELLFIIFILLKKNNKFHLGPSFKTKSYNIKLKFLIRNSMKKFGMKKKFLYIKNKVFVLKSM